MTNFKHASVWGKTRYGLLALAVTLTACGGGGGADLVGGGPVIPNPTPTPTPTPTPVPTPTPNGVITEAPPCVTPDEKAECVGTVKVTTNVPTSLSVDGQVVVANVPQGTNVSVPVTYTGAPGQRVLQLKDASGNHLGGSAEATLSCGTNSGWDTALKLPGREAGQCTAKLCYPETVFTQRVLLFPELLELGKGGTQVKNETGIAHGDGNGITSLGNFRVGRVDDFGRLTFAAIEQNGPFSDPASYKWKAFYVNPVTKSLHRYSMDVIDPNVGYNINVVIGPLPPAGAVPSDVALAVWSEKDQGAYGVYNGSSESMFKVWFFKNGTRELVVDGALGVTGSINTLAVISRPCP